MPKQKVTKRFPVEFGGVSIGEDTGAVGITISRDALPDIELADSYLCGRRINGKIVLGRRDDGETQGKLIETDVVIDAAFDTNSLSLKPKAMSSRLSCSLSEVECSELAKFANRSGYFLINSVEEITHDEEDANDD